MALIPSLNRKLINKDTIEPTPEKPNRYLPFTGNRGDRTIPVPDEHDGEISNEDKLRNLVRNNQGQTSNIETG